MSMSASCTITNNTGKVIVFSSITKLNDDSTWGVTPPVGTKIANGGTCVVSMGNASVFPKGVGFNASFVDASLDSGTISLDDPAVGAHHFSFNGNFTYTQTNPNGNSYGIIITTA
ncbi:MAG: hypothetical protein JKY54_12130 [Flavobacteriales bacterium]|nr:hypothetical protein [Flavobacteriales bacterium]